MSMTHRTPTGPRSPLACERGIALPLALLLLVVLGLSAGAAVFLSTSELRTAGDVSSANRALAAAEAAMEHGIAQLSTLARAGQNPDGVQIVTDSLVRFSYIVTVHSKREHEGAGGVDFNGDGDRTDVVLYDRSFGYAEAAATGNPGDEGYPVKVVIALATDGRSQAEVEAEVARNRMKANINNPLSLNSPTNAVLNGSLDVDGRLYRRDGTLVSSASLNPPYGTSAQSKAAAKDRCDYWKAGVKIPSEAVLELSGNMESVGHVSFDHDVDDDEEQNYDGEDPLSTFRFTPEEVLGVEAGALDGWKKAANQVSDWMNLSGVNYVVSGDVPSAISGSGILIIHNPKYDPRKSDCATFPATCVPGYANDSANQPMTLRINANGSFKGIIITDKLIRLNGNFSMLGGIVSLTTEQVNIPANGSGWVRWSCDAVRDAVEQAAAYDVRLSWQQRLE